MSGDTEQGEVLASATLRGQPYRVRQVALEQLDAFTLAEWESLEARATEPNAYLSPHFVLPAARHLTPTARPFLLLVEAVGDGERRLVGLGAFCSSAGTRRFPLRHLVAYRSRHSFLTGVLLDADDAANAASALFAGIGARRAGWYGVHVGRFPIDGRMHELCEAAALDGDGQWCAVEVASRATLSVAEAGATYLDRAVSPQRMKDLRRRRRRLDDIGPTSWRLLRGAEVTTSNVETFIHLEHLGWKGLNGSSLRAAKDEEFFREMITGFSRAGCVFFAELSVADQVIASTSNLMSGRGGFAFKIGWHPDYAKMAPGVLCELELVRQAPQVLSGLDQLDSGAEEGSYLEELWSGRCRLAQGIYATGAIGRRVAALATIARRIKGRIGAMRLALALALPGEGLWFALSALEWTTMLD